MNKQMLDGKWVRAVSGSHGELLGSSRPRPGDERSLMKDMQSRRTWKKPGLPVLSGQEGRPAEGR